MDRHLPVDRRDRDEHADADRRAGARLRARFARPEQGGTLTYLQVLIGYVVGRFIIARLFLPSYFRGDLLTAYALLETAVRRG